MLKLLLSHKPMYVVHWIGLVEYKYKLLVFMCIHIDERK